MLTFAGHDGAVHHGEHLPAMTVIAGGRLLPSAPRGRRSIPVGDGLAAGSLTDTV